MTTHPLKYLIAGTGGVGGSIAAFLALAGKDVTCIARGEHLAAIRENGLQLHSDLKGEYALRVPAYTAEEYTALVSTSADYKADVIFVCVKGYSVDSITELIKSAAHEHTVVIPILNVYGTGPRIQRLVPGVTVLDGCIYIVGFVSGRGEITQMGKIFRLVYGAHRSTIVSRETLEAVQRDLQESGIKADISDDIDRDIQMRFLGVISSEADRMTRIVKDLLTLTRLDYNRMEMHMQRMDLRELGQKAAAAMEGQAKSQGLTLTCELPEEMPAVIGDPERIQQVIINIITNAIKYNKPQGSIAITGGVEAGQVFLRVEDTGIGVPKADLERLFERFYRVDKARSRESGGTGLGLAIAKQIVETHGGRIGFDSEYGKGSIVTLYLPRAKEDEVANG